MVLETKKCVKARADEIVFGREVLAARENEFPRPTTQAFQKVFVIENSKLKAMDARVSIEKNRDPKIKTESDVLLCKNRVTIPLRKCVVEVEVPIYQLPKDPQPLWSSVWDCIIRAAKSSSDISLFSFSASSVSNREDATGLAGRGRET
jgi:hypothetical protein